MEITAGAVMAVETILVETIPAETIPVETTGLTASIAAVMLPVIPLVTTMAFETASGLAAIIAQFPLPLRAAAAVIAEAVADAVNRSITR